MKVTLRQLEVFVAIATHGQVTRAADAVAMTQSAASMALAELEQQLGLALFDRVGRQLLLNEAGRQRLPKAIDVLERAREIEALGRDAAQAFDLHLAASLTIGNHLMPGLLAELGRRHPGSHVRLSLKNTEHVVDDLLAFRIDLGFVEGPVQDERIQRYFWRDDRLVVFVASGHPWAGQRLLIDELRAANWILREKGSGSREVFDRAVANANLVPSVAYELEQPEAIRQSVQAGLGVGCLPWLELREAFEAGKLAPVETPFLDLTRRLQVVLHRQKHVSPGIRTVLGLCGIEPG